MSVHQVDSGETGSGKSNAAVLRDEEAIRDPDTSYVQVGSQPQSTGRDAYRSAIAQGCADRTVYESFDDLHLFVVRDWLPVNDLETVEGRIAYYRLRETWLDALSRRAGYSNLDDHPLIRKYGLLAFDLIAWQLPRKTIDWVRYALQPNSAEHRQLLRDCRDEETVRLAMLLPKHLGSLERSAAPAERFLDILSRSPALALRDRPGVGDVVYQMLDRGFNYIVEGGRTITQEEYRLLLQHVVLSVIRYKEQGGQRRVVLRLEESEANRLVSVFEARALQMLGKTGLAMRLIAQEPYWINDEITNTVMQNTDHLWFRCASAHVAALAGEDLIQATNPYAVKDTEYTVNRFQTGWEAVPVETETTRDRGGSSTSISHRDRRSTSTSLSRGGPSFLFLSKPACFRSGSANSP